MVLLFADTRYLMPTCRHQIKMDNERKEPICAQSAKGFAKHRPIYCPEPYGVMANYTLMTTHWSIIIWRIGKTVRAAFERIARDPIPERWITLIQRLDAEEDRSAGRGSRR